MQGAGDIELGFGSVLPAGTLRVLDRCMNVWTRSAQQGWVQLWSGRRRYRAGLRCTRRAEALQGGLGSSRRKI